MDGRDRRPGKWNGLEPGSIRPIAKARLRASGLPALPVVDAAGALVGMLTMDNITDLLLVRQARG